MEYECSEKIIGLSEEAVQARIKAGKVNVEINPASKSVSEIIKDNVFTYFNFIFCVLALILVFARSFHNMLFMLVVIINTAIGIIQELRAKQVLDRLKLISAPHAQVIRDGKKMKISAYELVEDDIVCFAAGNQIYADALVLSGQVEVNEALLTGEADAVVKHREDELLSGSFIISGQCLARLTHVGAASYASKLVLEASRSQNIPSEMMTSLHKLIQFIGIMIIPIGLLMFGKQYILLGMGADEAAVSVVAALVGMIPEGLILLTSVALALSVIRLARQKTVVHELYCIETLARVDVLCLDKTGTLTEGCLELEKIQPIAPYSEKRVLHILAEMANASSDNNATAQALKTFFANESSSWHKIDEVPFSSKRKYSSITFAEEGTFTLGAFEYVLDHVDAAVMKHIQSYLEKGMRVLMLVHEHQPLAVLVLADKLRAQAAETLAYFKEQGVSIKVISGDNPLAVQKIAERAGIENAHKAVDAGKLSDEQLTAIAEATVVFGRVSPKQKQLLAKVLKKQGHTVAMIGDGVNDILAMKEADCSIAMAGGSEAAAHAAQLVLLNSDFTIMPQIVNEGRRVINNIQRSASLFLVKNIYSLLVALLLMFFAFPYPFAPIQLTLISALTIGIPSFILAFEPSTTRVQGKFLETVLFRALPGGLTNVTLIIAAVAASLILNISSDQTSYICMAAAGCGGLCVLLVTCLPLTTLRKGLLAVMTLCFIGCTLLAYPLIVTTPMKLNALLLLGGLLLATPLLLRMYVLLMRRFKKLYQRIAASLAQK